jgi:RHS repeat-associated protein
VWPLAVAGGCRSSAYRHTFTYDAAGNRSLFEDGSQSTSYAYDAANRLRYSQDATGRTTFTFDACGNQLTQETPDGDITTQTWDGENQVRTVETPDGVLTTCTWNASPMRVAKETDGDTTKFLWDGQNIVREYDGTSLTTAEYTLAPQPNPEPYGDLLSQHRDGDSSFYHFDALGSAQALTDGSQIVSDQYTYEAFGKVVASIGTTENAFGWAGEKGYYRDDETGQSAIRRRQYDPLTGRFLSEDPAEDDVNLFRYVENNPANAVDPSGLESPRPSELEGIDAASQGRHWLLSSKPISRALWRDIPSKFVGRYEPETGLVRRKMEVEGVGLVTLSARFSVLEDALRDPEKAKRWDHDWDTIFLTHMHADIDESMYFEASAWGDQPTHFGRSQKAALASSPALIGSLLTGIVIDLGIEFGGGKVLQIVADGARGTLRLVGAGGKALGTLRGREAADWLTSTGSFLQKTKLKKSGKALQEAAEQFYKSEKKAVAGAVEEVAEKAPGKLRAKPPKSGVAEAPRATAGVSKEKAGRRITAAGANDVSPDTKAPDWKQYEQRFGGQQTPMTTTFQGKTVSVRLDKPPTTSTIIDFKNYNWGNSTYQNPFIKEKVSDSFAQQIAKYKTIRPNVHLQFSQEPPSWVVDVIKKAGGTYSVVP